MTTSPSSRTRRDGVPPDLRVAEREIDNAYRSNSLMTVNRSHAVWRFLAECEKWHVDAILGHHPNIPMLPDVVATLATPAMLWLWKTCSVDGPPISILGTDQGKLVSDFAHLAHRYTQFESVFTLASRGHVCLTRCGRRILTTRKREYARRDAYDRLVNLAEQTDPRCLPVLDAEIVPDVFPSVHVDGDSFSYDLDARRYRRVLRYLRPVFNQRFPSPPYWSIGRSTLMEYRSVLEFMSVISFVHWGARLRAIRDGCANYGAADSLIVYNRERLVDRIAQYTQMTRGVVDGIVRDLTFGERGIRDPDIALQPIVPLDDVEVCWAPSLVRDSNLERNLLVLLRRLPGGKEAYSVVSRQREDAQRERLVIALNAAGFRCWHGRISAWTPSDDIDLVVVDDREGHIMVLELKSFAAPADPREVAEKAQEIETGIGQIRMRRKMAADRAEPFRRELNVDESYSLSFAVVSDTSAGNGVVGSDDVAVVRTSDFIRKVESGTRLREIERWLREGAFLPVPGVDYEEVEGPVEIAGWTLEWYRISTVPGFPRRRGDGSEGTEASGVGK